MNEVGLLLFRFFMVSFSPFVRGIFVFVASACLGILASDKAQAAGADYDGNGFAEIPVLATSAKGSFQWQLFDPVSGATTTFTRGLGKPGDGFIIANWLYRKVTSAGVVTAPSAKSRGRLVWTIRTNVVKTSRSNRNSRRSRRIRKTSRSRTFQVQQHTKYLGRRGEIIITGGDFNGNGFSDALVLVNRGSGSYKWGLRGDFFLASYNPGLNVNRAYFDFGRFGVDKPFFFNPDGKSDWFAVLSPSARGYDVVFTQPFTKEVRSFPVGSIPDGANVPLPVQQDDRRDLLVFYGTSGGETQLVVKDLRGATVASFEVPLTGDITVGNYGPGPGEEIAVSSQGRFFIINPNTGRTIETSGPVGIAADSININTL